MKKQKNTLIAFFGLLVIVFLPITARAFEMVGEEKYLLPKEKTVREDLYVGAGSARVSGVVLGDLLIGGGEVSLSGTTTQDVNIAGGNITFTGVSQDDLRILGGDIVISGTASSSLIVFGGTIRITPEAKVGGEALIGGSVVKINGDIEDGLQVYGGKVFLNGRVEGDVTLHANQIEIGPDTEITGDLKYFVSSQSQVTIASGARIGGEVIFEKVEQAEGGIGFSLSGFITSFLMLLLGALFFGLFLKSFSDRVLARGMTQSAWKYFLLGLAFVIVVPFVVLFLFITIIGLPLAFLLLFVYIIALITAWFYASILLGSFLWQWMKKEPKKGVTWQGIVLGAFLMLILSFIPIVGWVIQVVLILIALGALLFEKSKELKKLR